MRKTSIVSAVVWLFVALAANAQVRGTGRLQGNVFDKATGKPIVGATITVTLPSGKTVPIVVKTDARGHWAALGMTPGTWNVDIEAPGYNTSRGTANISELSQTPAIKTELEPAAVQAAPEAVVPVAPSVPKEAIDAIKEGEALLKAKAGDVITTSQTDATGASTSVQHTVTADELKDNAKRSVADFERALPLIPDTTPELKDVRNQVYYILSQAYYRSGDVKNAIVTLQKLEAADPGGPTPDAAHQTRQVLLANMYLEAGELEQGRAILDKLPATAITDPTAYINIGILFMNKKNPGDAITYFTKAIALDPKSAESYYYRGLAEVQLKKNAEAKADLQQVLTLAPDSSEAKDAKQLLASLK